MKFSAFFQKTKLLSMAAIVAFSVSLTSCGGGGGKDKPLDPDPTPAAPSSQCELSTFQFKTLSNPGLESDATAVVATIQSRNLVLITVPEGTDLTKLVATFNVSNKATVKLGTAAATSGVTAANYTKDVDLTVTAEDGKHTKKYFVLVRQGDAQADAQVYSVMKKYNIPGIGVATTKGEKPAYEAGYGYSSLEQSPWTRTTPTTLFRLASVSKFQCALCIMSLYEEGKLSPSDYVFAPAGANGSGSPEGILYSMYPGTHAAGVDQITVHQLLTHTSGWNYNLTGGTDPIFAGSDSRFAGKSLKARVEYMMNVSPGSKSYSYYNLGYCVLGQIVEKLTGGSYEDYLRKVEAKAGVTDVWIAKSDKSGRRANECVYYAQYGGTAYGNDMTVVAACGAVINSPVGLMKLVCAIDYGTVVPDILQKETLDMIYTDYTTSNPPTTKNGYGYGWRILHYTLNNWATFHGGNINGTATIIVRGKNGVNGVLLCNSRNSNDDFDTALYLALDAIMARTDVLY